MPILQPDYKIFEMNKRLQQRTEESDNLWWDAFATEFFEVSTFPSQLVSQFQSKKFSKFPSQ